MPMTSNYGAYNSSRDLFGNELPPVPQWGGKEIGLGAATESFNTVKNEVAELCHDFYVNNGVTPKICVLPWENTGHVMSTVKVPGIGIVCLDLEYNSKADAIEIRG